MRNKNIQKPGMSPDQHRRKSLGPASIKPDQHLSSATQSPAATTGMNCEFFSRDRYETGILCLGSAESPAFRRVRSPRYRNQFVHRMKSKAQLRQASQVSTSSRLDVILRRSPFPSVAHRLYSDSDSAARGAACGTEWDRVGQSGTEWGRCDRGGTGPD